MSATTTLVPWWRSAGVWTIILGTVHMATVRASYPQSVRSVLGGGVIASVDAEPALSERRGVGFWYVTSGILLVGLGGIVHSHERVYGHAPPGTARTMLATGLWGIVLTPRSGFWVFPLIAWFARRARGRRPR